MDRDKEILLEAFSAMQAYRTAAEEFAEQLDQGEEFNDRVEEDTDIDVPSKDEFITAVNSFGGCSCHTDDNPQGFQ